MDARRRFCRACWRLLRHNLNHGIRDVRLFEIGRVFAGSVRRRTAGRTRRLALIATGGALEEGRAQAEREFDFYRSQGRAGSRGRLDEA